MKECSPELLSAYLDGDLGPSQARAVESHLGRCPECARALDDLESISRAARALPTAAAPTDPWRRIRRHLGQRAAARRALVPLALAAAATAVVWLGGSRFPDGPGDSPATSPTGELAQAISELDGVLATRLSGLAAPERRDATESLRALDEALSDLERALETDPSNGVLLDLYSRTAASRLERTRSLILLPLDAAESS